ncbi:hypothetical protein EUZ87_07460 [Lactiplantibacillus paraplantarum]|uniref:Uncharacterized protein n=1 Tax=Lactiplantibacillus paraplantarum TaxID=60520 RepID=A0A4Q9Y354_9LACO|nr:hypothetical protein EUZ87_07460 [Lactiplantibacillus paraplantarum]
MRCKLFSMRGNCGQGYMLKWVMLGDELGNIADDGIAKQRGLLNLRHPLATVCVTWLVIFNWAYGTFNNDGR